MKKLYRVLIFICLFVFLFSLFMIVKELHQRKEDAKTFEEVLTLALTPAPFAAGAGEKANISVSEAPSRQKDMPPAINMPLIRELNPHCVSWVYVDGTNINYPVMHTPQDPEEYIHKNFYGKKSPSGTPFLDGRCDLESENVIIYGHNMMNGTMFAHLKKYLEKGFFEEHTVIELYLADGWAEYEIFTVAELKSDDVWYAFINGADESIINNIYERSVYKTGISYSEGDKFITLSTCYSDEDEDRLVVVGIRKQKTEAEIFPQ